VEGLARMKDPGAVDALILALGDAETSVASSASKALARIGEPAVRPLVEALGHPSASVRAGAAAALRRLATNPPPDASSRDGVRARPVRRPGAGRPE
jgi:HEAT repeat protein